jgi:flagellar biogenesis protein FliO
MDAARQVLSVLFVLVLLGAALWALRRGAVPLQGVFARRTQAKTKSLQLIERVVLTPQHSLHLVQASGREWLLATHPQGCTVVSGGETAGGAK